jgi:hypothetical protein
MKDKKPEILYSVQVNEIISNPPGKLIRWGTTVIFMVFIVIVLFAWLIKYPEVISSPVVIVKSNLPVDIVSDINNYTVRDNSGEFIGRISLGIERWSKVAVGQKVHIKVSAFPYLEYGILRGSVKSKTLASSGNSFELEVLLPDGLTTLYKRNLEYIPVMQGTAEIITGDASFLQRIMNPPRYFISRNRN